MLAEHEVPEPTQEEIDAWDAEFQPRKKMSEDFCRLLVKNGDASIFDIGQACDELGAEFYEELCNPQGIGDDEG